MRHTRSKEKEVREKIKYLQGNFSLSLFCFVFFFISTTSFHTDERANRMKMLRENDGPAFNAYKWIQSNKDKFQSMAREQK